MMYLSDIDQGMKVVEEIEFRISEQLGNIRNISLSSGVGGVALFYAKLSRSHHRFSAVADRLMDATLEYCAEQRSHDWRLFPGLPGIGIALEYVSCRGGEPALDDYSDLDDLVEHLLLEQSWNKHYDLIHGLVGIGVYLVIINSERSASLFDLFLERLLQLSTKVPQGRVWMTDPQYQGYESSMFEKKVPNINLGVAHGLAGTIGLLAMAVNSGYGNPQARTMLDEATQALLSFRNKPGSVSNFGYVHGDRLTSRIAWCYGDLGNALMILRSGKVLGNDSFVRKGLAIAESVLNRPSESLHISDHGLCHGSAGIALLFSALHRESGKVEFKNRAQNFYAKIIKDAQHDFNRLASAHDNGARKIEYGLLTGLAGIGCSLLDAMGELSDGWSRWMLI